MINKLVSSSRHKNQLMLQIKMKAIYQNTYKHTHTYLRWYKHVHDRVVAAGKINGF